MVQQQGMQQGPQAQQESRLGSQNVKQMSEPPVVLTDKDHLYLKDALSWELLAMKKCHQLAGTCQNPEIAALANKIGSMHQQHYQRFLEAVDPQKALM